MFDCLAEGQSCCASDTARPLQSLHKSICMGLQETVKNYLASKRERGVTLAGALAKHRGYRNPDFLQKMVEHFDIKECGTCFAPELFNPNALPPEDYFERYIQALCS